MANSKAGPLENAIDRENIWKAQVDNKNYHKSFDFSNVNMSVSGNSMDQNLRKFHQMTLYIQGPRLFNHGEDLETSSSTNQTAIITSNLPESFSYNIGSSWSEPLSFAKMGPATNLLLQMAGSALSENLPSGVNRVASLKVWEKTQPLSLDLKIPVIDDGVTGGDKSGKGDGRNTNLVEALDFLGGLCLPSYDIRNNAGFYTPPPSPLNVNLKYSTFEKDANGYYTGKRNDNNSTTWSTSNYGRILLQLGGILLVDNCIIENVSVTYPNTKTMIRHDYTGITNDNFGSTGGAYLHPLLAEVNIKISTIEALTSDNYTKMLWARTQNTGTINADVTGTTNALLVQAGRAIESTMNAMLGKNTTGA